MVMVAGRQPNGGSEVTPILLAPRPYKSYFQEVYQDHPNSTYLYESLLIALEQKNTYLDEARKYANED